MPDNRSVESRSALMRRIKSKNTAPEIAVRTILYHTGYRYRLHCKDLPGTPDIVFRGRRKVIFVHGCYWHSHGCKIGRGPKSNTAYWLSKLSRNKERDCEHVNALLSLGWTVLTIWQCEITNRQSVVDRLALFLGGTRNVRSTL